MEVYFDLINGDISKLSIRKRDQFNCDLIDDEGNIYKGFLLAKSQNDNAFTVCDIDFQKSQTDNKFPPRLIFRRTDKKLEDKGIRKDSPGQRISFESGQDGYREFWKMIAFLYSFKDLVDTGGFDQEYQVISNDQFKEYIAVKKRAGNIPDLIAALDTDTASVLQSAAVLKILKSHKEKLEYFVSNNSGETDVQNWLDENDHSLRKERAMIFGLEFINHKREGQISGNRYDLLTRIGSHSKERVLIELKSPGDDVFEIASRETINDESSQFSLTPSLSRAIPQILEYKDLLESRNAGDPDLERIGEADMVYIAKCIIVIGSHQDNQRWVKNLRALRGSLNSSLEIWTYTDLVNKLDSTINNLESNLSNREENSDEEPTSNIEDLPF